MKYYLTHCQEHITTALTHLLKKHQYTTTVKLETPPAEKGDFAFPCFQLAQQAKQSPQKIAEELAAQLPTIPGVKKIEHLGGYINFFLDEHTLIKETLDRIAKTKTSYGYHPKKNQKVIIEHTSANPNGPLHVGRARNPIIGDTLVRIYKAAGYSVESQFYLDDLGKQVAILTWGTLHLKKNELPESTNTKPDYQHVGYYQTAHKHMQENPEIAEEINTFVHQTETGDQQAITQAHNAYQPVLDGINESLNRINITIDRYIPESQFVKDKSVEQVVTKLKKTPYCHQEDNAYYLDLKSFGIQGRNTKFFITRRDGTTLYATRDIAYHLWKAHHADVLINILGEDHKLESKQVEIALNLLNAPKIPTPVFYSFVSLPEGKMSTRRGRVVYLDDLIEEAIQRAYSEVQKRRGTELTTKQMQQIAEIIGIGALRYNIIKVQPEKDITFKWEEALNFEGNAAPFIQYAHARACSILNKAPRHHHQKHDPTALTHSSEIQLIKHLARFPTTIEDACINCRPHLIAIYLFEVAAAFNQFYRDCPVIPEKNPITRHMRLELVTATRTILANGLDLLGKR